MAASQIILPHICPTVQVLTAPELGKALTRNRFDSLSHLLAPFLCDPGSERVQTRTPATYDQITHDRFPVRLVDQANHTTAAEPLAVDLWLDQVGQDVAANVNGWLANDSGSDREEPWYAAVRDAVLSKRDLGGDVDSFNSPYATLVALSTANPDPLNALASLWEQAHASAADQPDRLRFVLLVHDCGQTDAGIDWSEAQKLHDTVRKTYGLHTALVPLFSAARGAAPPEVPAPNLAALWPGKSPRRARRTSDLVGLGVDDGTENTRDAPGAADAMSSEGPIGSELSAKDLTALATFAREFIVQSLVPFLERSAIVAHEHWVASRRSLGGRLFSVGRKYFGGGGGGGASGGSNSNESSRAGSPGPAGALSRDAYNATRGVYHPLAQLSQTRRLADLCLVLGDLKLAHAVYESLAKDYRTDKAWRHAAAATRMAGLSSLLVYSTTIQAASNAASGSSSSAATPSPLGSPNNNPDAYLVAAASLSNLPPTPADYDSLRATVLYYELYKSLAHVAPTAWTLASDALVRTAGEAEEVVSAVLLEQAAKADWHAPVGISVEESSGVRSRGRRRKYAFHLAMAAARYEKCGIKALSRRSLGEAAVLFRPPVPLAPKAEAETEAPSTSAELIADDASTPPAITSLSDPRFPPPSSTTLAPWLAIRTYMHHSLARQAYTVGDALDAVEHFLQLLIGGAMDAASAQAAESADGGEAVPIASAGVGGDWLDDFALAYALLGDDADRLVRERSIALPLRLFDVRQARLVSSAKSGAPRPRRAAVGPESSWADLEEEMLQRAPWRTPAKRPRRLVHRQQVAPGKAADGVARLGPTQPAEGFEVTVGETFTVELPVRNPLEAFLALGEVRVDYELKAPDGSVIAATAHAPIDAELAPLEQSVVFVPVTPTGLGTVTFNSISYRFGGLLPITESLLGRYSTPTAAHPGKPSVRNHEPLHAQVSEPIPRVVLDLGSLPTRLFHGETRRVMLTVTNAGEEALAEVYLLTSHPAQLMVDSASSGVCSAEASLQSPPPSALLTADRPLQPGASLDISLIVRGDEIGVSDLRVLCAFRQDGQDEGYTASDVHTLETYPSLEIRSATRVAFKPDTPFTLDLDVHNAGLPADDVVIGAISMYSGTWRIADGEFTSPLLAWQQSAAISLGVTSAKTLDEFDDAGDRWSVKQVQTLLEGRDVATSASAAPVLLQSRADGGASAPSEDSLGVLLSSYAVSRRSDLRQRFPTVPAHLHAHLFPLFSATSACISVAVSSKTLGIDKQHPAVLFLPIDSPPIGSTAGSKASRELSRVIDAAQGIAGGLYAESQRERTALLAALRGSELLKSASTCPLAVQTRFPSNLQHDFSRGPLLLPLDILVRNRSPASKFSYSLRFKSSTSAPFIGPLRMDGIVAALDLETVRAHVWISRAGALTIDGVDLIVERSGGCDPWRMSLPPRSVRVIHAGAHRSDTTLPSASFDRPVDLRV